MKLGELGEFGTIALFRQAAAAGATGLLQPIVDIGDDAAVWRPTPDSCAIATTDVLVEDIHFSLRYMSWYDVGWKAMAANVSDIAAMGGQPKAALVTAALKPDMQESEALDLFRGLADCAGTYGTRIVGGDTVTSPRAATIGVALYGETVAEASHRLLRRDRARPGNAIAVTGPLGASAAALELWRAGKDVPAAISDAHRRPRPRLREGQQIAAAGISCAMDVSDGLVGDLQKICQASGVAARLAAASVPLAEKAIDAFGPEVALRLALSGGEDYELIVCGDRSRLEGLPLIIIGEIVTGDGVSVVRADGSLIHLARAGYDAFL